MSDDIPSASESADFRDAVHNKASELDVPLNEVLFQSSRRDPLNVGTASDHKKGRWFAELWKEATSQRDSDTIHIRGLHYVIVQLERDISPPTSRTSWDRYRNAAKCYNYLTDAGTCARVLRYVPMGGLTDEKNNQERLTEYTGHDTDVDLRGCSRPTSVTAPSVPEVDKKAELRFDDLEEHIDHIANQVARWRARHVRFNTAEQQPYHTEVWSEKALPDAVRRTAKENGADAVVEGEGHLSYRVAHDFVNRVETAGKPAGILYLTDFDPAGEAMPGAMASKISWLEKSDALSHRVWLSRLAVTADQVDELDLPREPVEVDPSAASYHTLAEEWQEDRNGGAVELSALEADLDNYRRIVRDGLLSVSAGDLSEQNKEARQDFKDELADHIRDELDGAELDTMLSGLREWSTEFNEQLDDAREPLEELRELAEDDRRDDFRTAVREAIEAADIPDIDPPEGDAEPPAAPLYDSGRPYMENVYQIKRGGGE